REVLRRDELDRRVLALDLTPDDVGDLGVGVLQGVIPAHGASGAGPLGPRLGAPPGSCGAVGRLWNGPVTHTPPARSWRSPRGAGRAARPRTPSRTTSAR